jgi:hypothetical protein
MAGEGEATNWEGTPEAPPPVDDHASTRWEATPPPTETPAPGVLHPEKTRWEATRAETTPPAGLARSSDPEATTDDLKEPPPRKLGAPGQVINPESDATSWPSPPKPTSAPAAPEVTRWDGSPPGGSPPLPEADPGSTRWETSRAERPSAEEAPAQGAPDADPGSTRWETSRAERPDAERPGEPAAGVGPTRRFDSVLTPPERAAGRTARFDEVLVPPSARLPRGMHLSSEAPPPNLMRSGEGPRPRGPAVGDGPPRDPRFRILAELGRGGMGAVYRAVDERVGREVALKTVLPQLAASSTQRERFTREGQITAKLQHPNILRVHEAGELEDGTPYMACELVEGARTLGELAPQLERLRRVAYVRDAARGLGAAHARGIVHRDVKPANLLVDRLGNLKVADFGLAAGADLERLTRSGVQLGTPSYMAPEQVLSDRAALGPWTDVWALGAVLYELLTDVKPFSGASFPDLCQSIIDGQPRPPRSCDPSIDRNLEAIVLRCLSQQPPDRYPDGDALAAELDLALGGRTPEAVAAMRARRATRSRRWVIVVAGVCLVLGAGLVRLGIEWRADRARARAGEALRSALAKARAARAGDASAGLDGEAAALREAAEAWAAVPLEARAEADARVAESGAVARRAEVLERLALLRLDARDPVAAAAAAEELRSFGPAERSAAVLARVLAEHQSGPQRERALDLAFVAGRGADRSAGTLALVGEALARLGRPGPGAQLLADAPPELAAERLELLLQAGDAAGARAAALTLPEAVRREPAVAARIALALAGLGQGEDALAAAPGGASPIGARARGEAYAALGRPGAAVGTLDDATRLAGEAAKAAASGPARRADAAQAELARAHAARARVLLARGRRVQALHDLAQLETPEARLDRVVARWLGGESEVLPELEAIEALARDLCAPVALGAAAATWRARVALAGGDAERARAAAAAAIERGAGVEGEVLLARAELALGHAGEALDVVARATPARGAVTGPDAEGVALGALALLGFGRAREAAAEARRLPAGSPARVDLALLLVRKATGPAEVAGAASVAEVTVPPGVDPEVALVQAALVARMACDAPRPVPVPSLGPTTTEAVVARLLHEERRLRIASNHDAGARERADRLLGRVLALDPDHAAAARDQALLRADGPEADALAALDGLIARWPTWPEGRRTRLAWRLERQRPIEELAEDLSTLSAVDPAATSLEHALAGRLRAMVGDREGARVALVKALDKEEVSIEALKLAVDMARDPQASAPLSLADAQARLDGAIKAYPSAAGRTARAARDFRRKQLSAMWVSDDWKGIPQAARDLPHDGLYHAWRAAFGLKLQHFGQAILSFGDAAASGDSLAPGHAVMFTHTYGWQPMQDMGPALAEVAARRAEAPLDPAPRLALAAYYATRGRRLDPRGDDAASQAERIEKFELPARAADQALAAAELCDRPRVALVLSAGLLIDEGALAEAAAILDLAPEAHPEEGALLLFQRARLFARQGKAADAASTLATIDRLRLPVLEGSEYDYADDPALAPILGKPEMQQLLPDLRRKELGD